MGASGAFAAWVGPTGFVRLALAAFEGEILAGGEGFVDIDAKALVLVSGGGTAAASSMANISERSLCSGK